MTIHTCNKEAEIGEIHKTLKKLEPLAELVDPLRSMVETEKAKTWLSIQVAKVLKTASIVIGILATCFTIGWAVWKELKK